MPATPALERPVPARTLDRVDLRAHTRYPVELDLEYKLATEGKRRGCGRTVNLSCQGLLFEAFGIFELQPDNKIELCIDWPFQLNETCALKLVVRGRIVRRHKKLVAVIALRHEFRTSERIAREC
jgi:hypothetical protein